MLNETESASRFSYNELLSVRRAITCLLQNATKSKSRAQGERTASDSAGNERFSWRTCSAEHKLYRQMSIHELQITRALAIQNIFDLFETQNFTYVYRINKMHKEFNINS